MSSTDKKLLALAVIVLVLIGIAKVAEQAVRLSPTPAPFETGTDTDGFAVPAATSSGAEATSTSSAGSGQTGGALLTGELVGQVTLGPTCPVERVPPDPQCADKPYQTTVVVSTQGREVGRQQTDAHGRFVFAFLPGTYTVTALGGNPLPRCTPETASLARAATTTLVLSCDTGIR